MLKKYLSKIMKMKQEEKSQIAMFLMLLCRSRSAVGYADYRTINLISHASQIVFKILTKSLECKTMMLISQMQYFQERLWYKFGNWSDENSV